MKFNYATQTGQNRADGGEFRRRLSANSTADAIKQAQLYKSQVRAVNVYVLYLIAAPTIKIQLPPKLRDSGWAHYDHRDRRDNREKSGMDAAKSEIEKRLAIRGLAIRGNYEIAEQGTLNPRDCSFYCCLIEV